MLFRCLSCRRAAALGLALALLLTVAPAVQPARAAEEPVAYEAIIDTHAKALVTVRFILKINPGGGGQAQEREAEAPGVIIEDSGLILCSNTQLGGFIKLMRGGQNATYTPTDIKILIGDDNEGKSAKLLARDTEMDLAWVQLNDKPENPLPHVDLAQGVVPKAGQTLVSVRQMSRFFDRTPIVSSGIVGGITRKPREYYVPSGTLNLTLGLPVFTATGKLVGLAVLPIVDDDEGMRLGSVTRQDITNGLILPAVEVHKATQRAKEIAAENPAPAENPEPAAAPAP